MKILFTTHYIDPQGWYDYFETNSHNPLRISYPLKISYGLRFIAHNLPQVEILEFPTWPEYVEKLKEGWDVVGFSFHTPGTTRVLRMAEEARKAGVSEIWAGNYGAVNPAVKDAFDRVIGGYAEKEIAGLIGEKIERIKHPPLIDQWWIKPLPFRVQRVAQLQTQRGCPMQCTFCQTPRFAPKPEIIPLESIEEVLRFYKTNGVDWVAIPDENFGLFAEHTERVVELIKKYGLFWSAQSRTEVAIKNLDHWNDHHFMGVGVGVESVKKEALTDWKKKLDPDAVLYLRDELHKRNRYIWGYYMIGNAQADFESTLQEIEAVYQYKLGYTQTTILTPYPGTRLWEDIESEYGIFEKDWERFDTKHLTWNHPNLTPDQLEKLLEYSCLRLNDARRHSKFIWRIYKSYSKNLGSYARGAKLIANFPINSYRFPINPPIH